MNGIDGHSVRFSSRSDGNARSAPSSTAEPAHPTPAPPSYDSSNAPKRPGASRIKEMSETVVPLLASLGGEATTLLPYDYDAPTPAPQTQIDSRLPAGFYYVRDVFSESQEETVKNVLHDNTWEKYHGRSVQHFGHAYLGQAKSPPHLPSQKNFPRSSKRTLPRWNAWASHTLLQTKSQAQCMFRGKASATTKTTPC